MCFCDSSSCTACWIRNSPERLWRNMQERQRQEADEHLRMYNLLHPVRTIRVVDRGMGKGWCAAPRCVSLGFCICPVRLDNT